MQEVKEKIQVNIPFTMLHENYLDRFIRQGLNPEIGLDAAALERFSLSDFSRIAQRLHDNGLNITLHGPFMDLSAGSPDPAVRQLTRRRFAQVARLLPVFKPQTVVCHAGYEEKRYGFCRDQWIEHSLATWSRFAGETAAAGARLMLENVYETGPEQIRVLFENLDYPGVGFCLDTGHQSAFSTSSLQKWIDILGPCLGQLHLHDNLGRRDEHLAPGSGKIDFRPVVDFLKKRKNDLPVITLEPHREEDLPQGLAYLHRIFHDLRR